MSIVNKDNELIKKYLDTRKETSTKLSNKAKELLDLMIIVDYDYIAYDDNSYSPDVASFENADERKIWLKEIKGSLEDNVSLNDNYDGDALFINSDSIF